jgi:hypothetical protein
MMFLIVTGIYKATNKGSRGSELSKSKVMRRESEGLTSPNVDSKAFHCEGKVCKTTRTDMVIGDWANSLMRL